MSYKKNLKEIWDEYAIKKTIEYDLELARKEAVEKGKSEVVRNLLSADKFSIAEIANFANVTEAFVRKVKKEMK
jgi:hypothetical protein